MKNISFKVVGEDFFYSEGHRYSVHNYKYYNNQNRLETTNFKKYQVSDGEDVQGYYITSGDFDYEDFLECQKDHRELKAEYRQLWLDRHIPSNHILTLLCDKHKIFNYSETFKNSKQGAYMEFFYNLGYFDSWQIEQQLKEGSYWDMLELRALGYTQQDYELERRLYREKTSQFNKTLEKARYAFTRITL